MAWVRESVLAMCAALVVVASGCNNGLALSRGREDVIMGTGRDTPREALCAYVQAMWRLDKDGVLDSIRIPEQWLPVLESGLKSVRVVQTFYDGFIDRFGLEAWREYQDTRGVYGYIVLIADPDWCEQADIHICGDETSVRGPIGDTTSYIIKTDTGWLVVKQANVHGRFAAAGGWPGGAERGCLPPPAVAVAA